jgi:integrase
MNKRTRVKNYPGIYSRKLSSGKTVYDVSYRLPGEKNPRWVNGIATLKEAKARQVSIQHSKMVGETPSLTTPTLAAFIEADWLTHLDNRMAVKKLAASTRALYELDARTHIIPALGTVKLASVDETRIESLQAKLIADGKSDWTARRITNTLSSILTLAVRKKLIRTNPALLVEKPEPRTAKAPTLTLPMIYSLADNAPNRTLRVLILAAAMTGMRQSELFGLRWVNVSLEEGAESITVTEQHYRGVTKDSTKTPQGRRLIPIPSALADELRTLWTGQQVDDQPNPHGLVFPTSTGLYWPARRFHNVWAGHKKPGQGKKTQGIRDRSFLPHLKFHHLRSFYVSEVRAAGLPTSYTEQLVGHTSENVHRGYTAPTADQDEVIRAGLEGRFGLV